MKTRSNMPLFVVACSNVKQLTDEQINMLRCGDYLVKRDASGEHAYKVTFKSATGMCITYHDAYCVETQSYDLVDGHWVYNSEDKTIIAEPQIETIVDAHGHPRFIEGECSIAEGRTDFTVDYNKWSLSGTHLMLVVAFTIENGETFAGGRPFIFELPQWVMDKIIPVWNDRYIINQNVNLFADDFTNQTVGCVLDKNDNKLYYYFHGGSLTATKTRHARIQFDLLIDNE